MWITGFDVPSLTYLYNDKPLQKHQLIQTISRVNRKYSGKEYGLIVDYIGIRDNMRQAMKLYGGDTSVAPTEDDVEQATNTFREELEILKQLFRDYDLKPFLDPNCDPVKRYTLLAKAAEFVFVSTDILKTQTNDAKGSKAVSFKTYFLKIVKRMRTAFEVCQPSGELGEEESALAQCFMAIAGFVRKMGGTSEVDTDTMNRQVAKMVEEALKYTEVESILEQGEEEDLFSPEFIEKLSYVKMPATKLELLVKLLKKQIKEYGKTNQVESKKFQEMLEKTIEAYHERRKQLTAEEAGETQEQASEDIIKNATEQALQILEAMKESKAHIKAALKTDFADSDELAAFVNKHVERKKTNALKRRTRLMRKLRLQQWDYFCTFTYSDELHTEESFRKKLSNTLKHLVARNGWKYVGVWERSPEKNRLHFHGIFQTPKMVGTMETVRDYDTKKHRMQTTYQNSHFLKHFGRNDFKPIDVHDGLSEAANYITKYMEKTGERLVYGGNLPTYFLSDVLDEDVICPFGAEDRKILLADKFTCINEGEIIGAVSKETIAQLPKCN